MHWMSGCAVSFAVVLPDAWGLSGLEKARGTSDDLGTQNSLSSPAARVLLLDRWDRTHTPAHFVALFDVTKSDLRINYKDRLPALATASVVGKTKRSRSNRHNGRHHETDGCVLHLASP